MQASDYVGLTILVWSNLAALAVWHAARQYRREVSA